MKIESEALAVTLSQGKKAARLRKLADGLTGRIEYMRRPMTQNPTPKRHKEYTHRLLDADDLERGQQALRALADEIDAGTPLGLALDHLTSRDEIIGLVRHGRDSKGYYHIASTHQYSNVTPDGRRMQELLDAYLKRGGPDPAAESKRTQRRIDELLAEIRFVDIPGFFPTPEGLADRLVELATLDDGFDVLEPSAGIGSLCQAVQRSGRSVSLQCFERIDRLAEITRLRGFMCTVSDFLDHPVPAMAGAGTIGESVRQVDRVIMNPPFENLADVDHVQRAAEWIRPAGGRIVAIMSNSPFFRDTKKAVAFREWLDGKVTAGTMFELPVVKEHWFEDIEPGAFAGIDAFRRTSVMCRIVVIQF